jgi:betaine reductase
MIVGKGSLFLGRMTNLFDGVSFVIERNNGVSEETNTVSKEEIKKIIAQSLKKLALDMIEE